MGLEIHTTIDELRSLYDARDEEVPHETMTSHTKAKQLHPALDSPALELAYETSCREVEYIHSDENARRSLVQQMLLEAERDDLHEKLAHKEDRIEELESHTQELQGTLDGTLSELEIAHSDARIRLREIETLKVESRL